MREDAQKKTFVKLQSVFMLKLILKLLHYHKSFVVKTNVSNIRLAAGLMQEADGKLHPVAFASTKLNAAEEKYSTLEKECLVFIWAVTKFRLFFSGE